MTVAELHNRVGAGELIEWQAFARIDPFGSAADDYRAGLYPSMKANSHRGKDSDKPVVMPLDLFPWRAAKAEVKKQSPEELAASIKALIDGAAEKPKDND